MDAYGVRLAAGEVLFREGEAADCAWLIEEGEIEISIRRDHWQRVLTRLGPGALIGEMGMIGERQRNASARAVSASRLTRIDAERLADRIAAADPVVQALLESQVRRYRSLLDMVAGRPESGEDNGGGDSLVALHKMRLESELRDGMGRGELELRLQPIEEIESGRIAGYEALVRWRNPERGMVPPDEFIRLAEETSLILAVGDHILEQVTIVLAGLRARGVRPLPFVSMNLSARQLADPELVPRILGHLQRHGLPADRLKLEITESLALNNAHLGRLLRNCHDAGMRVGLDDFGSGYSNLGLLLELPFDQVKLDATFARALDRPRGVALAGAAVAMAKALGCELVAEGVETAEQRATLHRLGCGHAQGYLIGMPRSPEDVVLRHR